MFIKLKYTCTVCDSICCLVNVGKIQKASKTLLINLITKITICKTLNLRAVYKQLQNAFVYHTEVLLNIIISTAVNRFLPVFICKCE